MNCKYCGAEITENSKFCSECGMPQAEDERIETKAKNVRPKGKTLRAAALIAALIVIFALFFSFNYFSNPSNKLKGVWQRSGEESKASATASYSFTLRNGDSVFSQNSENGSQETATFEWCITDDNELIILWSSTSCTKYAWNPNLNNYSLSPNEYSWYLKGNKLYLSSSSADSGYYTYVKQGL